FRPPPHHNDQCRREYPASPLPDVEDICLARRALGCVRHRCVDALGHRPSRIRIVVAHVADRLRPVRKTAGRVGQGARRLADEAFSQALGLSALCAFVYAFGCVPVAYGGDAAWAIDWCERAMRLSPLTP